MNKQQENRKLEGWNDKRQYLGGVAWYKEYIEHLYQVLGRAGVVNYVLPIGHPLAPRQPPNITVALEARIQAMTATTSEQTAYKNSKELETEHEKNYTKVIAIIIETVSGVAKDYVMQVPHGPGVNKQMAVQGMLEILRIVYNNNDNITITRIQADMERIPYATTYSQVEQVIIQINEYQARLHMIDPTQVKSTETIINMLMLRLSKNMNLFRSLVSDINRLEGIDRTWMKVNQIFRSYYKIEDLFEDANRDSIKESSIPASESNLVNAAYIARSCFNCKSKKHVLADCKHDYCFYCNQDISDKMAQNYHLPKDCRKIGVNYASDHVKDNSIKRPISKISGSDRNRREGNNNNNYFQRQWKHSSKNQLKANAAKTDDEIHYEIELQSNYHGDESESDSENYSIHSNHSCMARKCYEYYQDQINDEFEEYNQDIEEDEDW